MALYTKTLAVHVLTNGNILHLGGDDAGLGACYLSYRLTCLDTIVNPLLAHGWKAFLQVYLIVGVGIWTAGVVDVNRSIRLHVWYAMLIACNGWRKVYFYHTHANIWIQFALHVSFLALGVCFMIVNHTLKINH